MEERLYYRSEAERVILCYDALSLSLFSLSLFSLSCILYPVNFFLHTPISVHLVRAFVSLSFSLISLCLCMCVCVCVCVCVWCVLITSTKGREREKERDISNWCIALAHKQTWCFADCLVYFDSYQEIA